MTDAIETEGLVKRYRSLRRPDAARAVVDGLDLRVPSGGVTGLLGPNGSGKSTVTRMLLGLTRPDAGRATVLGHDVWRDSLAVRRAVAFVPAERAVFDWMRVGAFMEGVAKLSERWDAACAARLEREWEVERSLPMRALSTGARSRLFLLAALARRTPVLVLDEPTTGLDPAAVESALAALVAAAAEGSTILLVTHRLEEVERICDRVVLMGRGRALLSSSLDDLQAGWREIDVSGLPSTQVESWEEVTRVTTIGEQVRLLVRTSPATVMDRVHMLGGVVVRSRALGLKEIYLAVAGRTLDAGGTHAADDDLA